MSLIGFIPIIVWNIDALRLREGEWCLPHYPFPWICGGDRCSIEYE